MSSFSILKQKVGKSSIYLLEIITQNSIAQNSISAANLKKKRGGY